MRAIAVTTLGNPAVRAPDGAGLDTLVRRPKPVALLCRIALGGADREQARSDLLAMFWPEADQARAQTALRKTLHTLRAALGEDAIVSRGRHRVSLGRGVTCDAVDFAELYARGRYAEALARYNGPFMAGFHLSGCKAFEGWMDGQRARLADMALTAAVMLRDTREQEGEMAAALYWAYRAESLAPQNEEVLRRTLHLMAQAGDRAGAIRKYDRFATMMEEEFCLHPEEETERLVGAFRAPRGPTVEGTRRPGVGASLAVLSLTLRGTAAPGQAPGLSRPVAREALEAVMGAARRSARDGDAVVRLGSRSCVIIASGARHAIGRNLKARMEAEVERLRATGRLPDDVRVAFRIGRPASA